MSSFSKSKALWEPDKLSSASSCPTSSPALRVVNVLDFCHSNRCALVSPINLQLPNETWCWTLLHVCACITSSLVRCMFCILVIILLTFTSPLYILGNSSLSDVSFCVCVPSNGHEFVGLVEK